MAFSGHLYLEELETNAVGTTSTYTGAQRMNPNEYEAIEVILDLTSFVTAASLTLSIEEFVEAKSGYVQILASAAITAVGSIRLVYGPHSVITANRAEVGFLGHKYRIVVTHGNANSHTYTVTRKLIRRCD